MAATPETTFASAFPAADEAHWKTLVERVLKGAPFEKLVGKSYDGIAIQPLYPRAVKASPMARATSGGWETLARIDHTDAASANRQALTDLENGAHGLVLTFAGSTGAYGFGLRADEDTLDHVLDAVVLETGLPIELDVGSAGTSLAAAFEHIVKTRKISTADLHVHFGLDPLHEHADVIASTALRLNKAGYRAPIIVADARRVHQAGGTEAQELALALASALSSLRALESAGVSLEEARGLISFRLAADADQFLTLAKFRALRRLFARIEIACGLTPKPIHIHAETAWRMMTRRDPYVNLLRTTTAAFAAGIGGADRISVLPFTQALGLPDGFARRLARNTQLVLLEEAHLGRVEDAGAGAGSIETLTDALASAAWTLFQQSETSSLPLFLLSLSKEVAVARSARLKNIARRKDPLTGTSEFPNVHEKPVEIERPLRNWKSDTLFPAMRLAQDFEALRDRAEACATRPKIFLATLGTVADYTARAMFAKNFFEAGGLESVIHDSGDLRQAFAASGATLACLVSSDAIYAEQAVAAATELAPKAAKIYLAGRPGDLEPALKEAGVSGFIYVGCDLIEILTEAFSKV
jgi:methylmalonyl-CoA mutase